MFPLTGTRAIWAREILVDLSSSPVGVENDTNA